MKTLILPVFLISLCATLAILSIPSCSKLLHEDYPALSAALEKREAELAQLSIKSIAFGMTVHGEGFDIKSDACPGSYPYKYRERFNFSAKHSGDKWIVSADPEIKKTHQDIILREFEIMISEALKECAKASEIASSWKS